MPDNLIPLSQIANIIGGYAFKSGDFSTTGFPVVKIGSIEPPVVNLSSGERISPEKVVGLDRFRLVDRDVVLAMTGATIGKAGRIRSTEVSYLNQRVAKLSAKAGREFDDFIFALVSRVGFDAEVINNSNGSAQANISTEGIGRILVPDFSPAQQFQIGRIIAALDEKIELNRRMNETLEALAQSFFKSWFVDAIVNGLPDGWRDSTIGDLCDFEYGKALKEEVRRPGSIPVYGSNGHVGWHDEAIVKGPGIVVGRKGNAGIVTWSPTDFFPIDTTFYVVAKGECRSLYFLFHALRAHDLASLGADSAVPGLNRNMAYLSEQVLPPLKLQEAFDKQVRPLFERVHCNNEESNTLTSLRNALLPRLLSGEIGLPQ